MTHHNRYQIRREIMPPFKMTPKFNVDLVKVGFSYDF